MINGKINNMKKKTIKVQYYEDPDTYKQLDKIAPRHGMSEVIREATKEYINSKKK